MYGRSHLHVFMLIVARRRRSDAMRREELMIDDICHTWIVREGG